MHPKVQHILLVCATLTPTWSPASSIRIAAYNIEDDINGNTTPLPGLYQVLEGIGEEQVAGNVQPLDILGLEETTSNSITVAPIVSNLNSYYNGAAVYAQSTYQATQSGSNASGNGPNALVYNTLTLKLIASVGVGTPHGSSNGIYRQPVRYEFQPVGDTGTTGIFYVYVEHTKSGSTSSDATARGEEAAAVRANAATLPANSSIIYMGDLNATPPEAEFTNFQATGAGQAFDPLNYTTSPTRAQKTDSSTSLRYRDDYQLMTADILNGTSANLNYISNSLHAFGNNGSVSNPFSSSNTALNSNLVQDGGPFISASSLYSYLGTASDHLPIVADYILGYLPAIWTGGAGSWSSAAKWSTSAAPSNSALEVQIDNHNSAASTVTLDQNATVADILLDANDSLIISSGKSLTLAGPAVTTFSGSVSNAGSISAVTLSVPGSFTQTGSLAVSSSFTNSGTTTLSGTQIWSQNATFTNTGSVTFNTDAGSAVSGPLILNASAGTLTFNSAQHLQSLSLAGTAKASLSLSSTNTLVVKSLVITGPAILDLASNNLIIDYTGSSPISALRSQLHSVSLYSSIAAADPQHLLAIGYAEAFQLSFTSYSDQTLDSTTLITKLTYLGDANLDGHVDAADYALLDKNFAKQTPDAHWTDGDFNYDGLINSADYLLLDTTYLKTHDSSMSSLFSQREAQFGDTYVIQLLTSLPEPSSFAYLLAAPLLLPRPRRQRNCASLTHALSPSPR